MWTRDFIFLDCDSDCRRRDSALSLGTAFSSGDFERSLPALTDAREIDWIVWRLVLESHKFAASFVKR